jgi:hypothetical protein
VAGTVDTALDRSHRNDDRRLTSVTPAENSALWSNDLLEDRGEGCLGLPDGACF